MGRTGRVGVLGGVAPASLMGVGVWFFAFRPGGREVRWRSGDVELVGRLHAPDGPGPHSLAVIVLGCTPHPGRGRGDDRARGRAEPGRHHIGESAQPDGTEPPHPRRERSPRERLLELGAHAADPVLTRQWSLVACGSSLDPAGEEREAPQADQP